MTSERIPHNRPLVTDEDRAAVAAVLMTGQLAQGVEIAGLERDFNHMMAGGASCAVASGTAALFLALKGLDVGPGHTVAIPTYACSALLNAVYMAGATPRLVDVRDDNFTIDPAAVERQAPDADTVIAVHCFGATADVESLCRSKRRVIEDCCQSLGGPQGHVGDAAVYSFYATKIITGGHGGLVWSRNNAVVEAVRDYREFDCRENYVPRFNFQMTEMQAAMIRSQLRRLDAIRLRRRSIADAYRDVLPSDVRVQKGFETDDVLPYRFVIRADDAASRDRYRTQLDGSAVVSIIPVERYELLHRYLGENEGDFPVAERLVDETLSLPLFPGLSDKEINSVRAALADI